MELIWRGGCVLSHMSRLIRVMPPPSFWQFIGFRKPGNSSSQNFLEKVLHLVNQDAYEMLMVQFCTRSQRKGTLSGDILIRLSTYIILSIYLSLSYVHPFLPHPSPFGYVLMFYDDHGLLLFYAIPWTSTYIVYPLYCSVLPL